MPALMSAKNDPEATSSRWTWRRWAFLLFALAGITYLGIKTFGFLTEAQMSLGLNRTPGIGIDALLVNRTEWHPPKDSLLRPAQVHVVLRVVETIDSLDAQGVSKETMRRELADLMNDHLFDRSSYTWCRDAIDHALFEEPSSRADSSNVTLLTMFRPRFVARERVFTASLDTMLLVR